MIKVSLRQICELNLPLDNTSKILERGNSKNVLKEFEKKYKEKSHMIATHHPSTAMTWTNMSREDRKKWVTNYEIYVRSSFVYKFWIWFYKIKKSLDL